MYVNLPLHLSKQKKIMNRHVQDYKILIKSTSFGEIKTNYPPKKTTLYFKSLEIKMLPKKSILYLNL